MDAPGPFAAALVLGRLRREAEELVAELAEEREVLVGEIFGSLCGIDRHSLAETQHTRSASDVDLEQDFVRRLGRERSTAVVRGSIVERIELE